MRGLVGAAAALSLAMGTVCCSGLESSGDTYCSFHSCTPDASSELDPDGPIGDTSPLPDTSPLVDASLPDPKANPWWCESNGSAMSVVPPPTYPPDAMPTAVRYVVPIFDFASLAANLPQPVDPRNIMIVACPGGNCPDGGTPLNFVPPSAALPAYQVVLPFNFQGSILISDSPNAPPTAPGYFPTDYFFGGPLVGTTLPDGSPLVGPDGIPIVYGTGIAPITTATLAGFYGGLGGSIDTKDGLLVARILDCNGNRAANVLLTVTNPSGTGYTLLEDYEPVQGNPTPIQTDPHAIAGYANMVPLNYQLSATTPDRKATYGLGTVAHIVANTLTEVEVRTDSPLQVGR